MANTRSQGVVLTRLERPTGLARPGAAVPDGRRVPPPPLEWQPSLLDACPDTPRAVPDVSFSTVERVQLDDRTWVDLARGWLAGADGLFAALLARAPWKARTVPMYGRIVAEPRLSAWWGIGAADPVLPPEVADIAAALESRYGLAFDSVGAALYRDGRDSVAPHSDRIRDLLPDPMVAIVSLGGPRRFVMRRKRDGRAAAAARHGWHADLASGDLLVMSGTCQDGWEHGVPKVALAAPRISLQLRPRAATERPTRAT
jgi:alkylated DNA repair dioxygenase AlkB